MNIKHRQSCRICGNTHLTPVVDLGLQYFQGLFNKPGLIEAPSRKTPNLVVRCDTTLNENACGLIQTKHSIPSQILYTNYWYRSGISNTMTNHLKNIVNYCLKTTQKTSGKVLDIASNDNTLLRSYSSQFTKIGIDPSNIAAKQTDSDILVINEIFPSNKLSEYKFDIITSIACFYDIEDPIKFALSINQLLTNDGIWVFEVAYWPSMLENLSYDSIVNEHIIHYHIAPLEILFDYVGLKIIDVQKTDTNGGSILVSVTKITNDKYDTHEGKENLTNIRIYEFNAKLDEESTYIIFRNKINEQASQLKQLLIDLKNNQKIVHIYGASTKLNTILGYCDIGPDLIEYASERSPEKFGTQTISGIKIISESDSLAMKPDYYLVGPYHFKKEILEREEKTRQLGIKFIFPLPTIEIL